MQLFQPSQRRAQAFFRFFFIAQQRRDTGQVLVNGSLLYFNKGVIALLVLKFAVKLSRLLQQFLTEHFKARFVGKSRATNSVQQRIYGLTRLPKVDLRANSAFLGQFAQFIGALTQSFLCFRFLLLPFGFRLRHAGFLGFKSSHQKTRAKDQHKNQSGSSSKCRMHWFTAHPFHSAFKGGGWPCQDRFVAQVPFQIVGKQIRREISLLRILF